MKDLISRSAMREALKAASISTRFADEAPTVPPILPVVPITKKRHNHYDNYVATCHLDGEDVLYKKNHRIVDYVEIYCPICGKKLCSRFTNYCPNCGAKMDMEAMK